MTLRIILLGPGGELDRQTIQVNPNDRDDLANDIYDALSVWKDTLAAGDIIRIVEVE